MANNMQSRARGDLFVLLALAWPTIAEQLLLTAVGYVDAAMVGSLGANATAAVAINSSTQWLINGLFGGLGVGFSVQVAHCIGAKEYERTCAVMRQSVLAVAAFGVFMMAVCMGLSPFWPGWMGGAPEILPDASRYLFIFACGLPFSCGQAVFASVLRCMGDTRTPLLVGFLTNVMNVIMNFLFIYSTRQITLLDRTFTVWGAGLGVAGAALATSLALLFGALMLLFALYHRPDPYKITFKDSYRPERSILQRAAELGLPAALDRIVISTGQLLMTRIVSSLGTTALAANYVAVTAEQICYMPAYGISFAATALVGQSTGARDRQKTKSYGTLSGWVSIVTSVVSGLIILVFAHPLASLFSSDLAVIALAATMLRIVAISEPLFGLSVVLGGVLRGSGDSRFPFYVSAICMWGIRVVLAPLFVFVFKMGLHGVWYAMNIDVMVRGAILAARVWGNKWLDKIEPPPPDAADTTE